MAGEYISKFDIDLVLDSFKPLEKLEKMMKIKQDKYNKIEDKLS